MKRLLSDCYRKPDLESLEKADLCLILKFFKSPYMEKRLKGLNEIKELVERVTKSSWGRESSWLTAKYLSEWITNEQIVQQILSYSHPEMLKRVSDILIFLFKNDLLSNEHLELLWESAVGKHDSLEIEAHKAIMDIAPYLKIDMLMFLYQKIKQIDLHDYDERVLKFIKDFSLKALDQAFSARSSLDDFAIEIFMPLIQDNCPVNLCDNAVGCIAEILKHPIARGKIYKYQLICMENVVQANSVPQSLKLLTQLFSLYQTSSQLDENVKKLDGYSGGIITKILENFENYMKKGPTEYDVIVNSRYTHKENIKIRLKTFEYFIVRDLLNANFDHFHTLWSIFVTNPSQKSDSELFFKWLDKSSKERINKTLTSEIFNLLFCHELPIESLCLKAFECFKDQFLLVNLNEKNIELRSGILHQRINENLIGHRSLYEIAIKTTNNEIFLSASTFIVALNLKLSKSLQSCKVDIWMKFINSLIGHIQKDRENVEIVSKVLKIFQFFLEENCNVGFGGTNAPKQFYYRCPQDKDYHKLLVTGNETLRNVRKIIAEHYKKPWNTIVVKILSTLYDSTNDGITMSNFPSSSVIQVDFSQPRSDEASPREFLAKHQTLQDLLFTLLSDPSKPYCTEAWTLLTSLPINERIKSSLYELTDDIHTIIDHNSLYKLLYCLVIVKEMIQDHDWVSKFKEKKGIEYVMELFKEFDVLVLSPATCLKYSTVMIFLMEEFFKFSIEIDNKFVEKLFDCLIVIGKHLEDPEDEEAVGIARSAKNIFSSFFNKSSPSDTEVFDAEPEKVEIVTRAILMYPNLHELIKAAFLMCKNKYYPNSIMNLFLEIATNCPKVYEFMSKQLFELLGVAVKNSQSFYYWNLLAQVIKETIGSYDFGKEIRVVRRLLKKAPAENSGKEKDVVLWGLLSVIKVAIEKKYMKVKTKFLRFILHDCLFEVATSDNPNTPKCKSDENRKIAFEILEASCDSRFKLISETILYLNQFHEDPHWRTNKYTDWNYSPIAEEKSVTGFVGLKNIGNICYMNSNLQQLFNIPTFCEQILSTKDISENKDDSILYALQFIFSGLKSSAKQYTSPKKLCGAFKDWDGKPLNVYDQMDADEFFNNLMDKIETAMKGGSNAQCIKNHFGGVQTTECIGKNTCSHRSERNESFLTLPVQVKNKKSLLESLESFVEGEILEGDNAYQCDYCETKVTALRRVCIKHLPNILIIVLRRFEFNFDTMNRVKVNDLCEFPLEIDMEPYTQEGLERKEAIKELMKDGPGKETPPKKYPDEYYKFSLKGITIHTGTAESGHYYSYIQDRSSTKWFEFNDIFVNSFDPDDIPAEAFGGVEKWASMYYSNYTSNREKYRNAYMLFYEREGHYLPRGKDDENLEPVSLSLRSLESIKFQEVLDENERYWRCKSVFSTDYFAFVVRLLRTGNAQITKFACAFFLVIFIRSKEIIKTPEFVTQLEKNLKKFEDVRNWISEVICIRQILKELILDCPISEKRRLIIGIFTIAFEGLSKDMIVKVFKSLLNRYGQAVGSKNVSSYFELLFVLAKQAPEVCSQCLPVDMILATLKGEELRSEFPDDYTNSDIYFGYKKEDAEVEKNETFTLEEAKNIPFLGALLGILCDYFSIDNTKKVFEKSIFYTLIQINHKVGTRYIGQMYSKLCAKSKEKTKEYLTALINSYKEVDYDKAKIYFRQLSQLLKIEDENKAERVDQIMRTFVDIMKDNKCYLKITEVSVDFIFKLASRIPEVKEWLIMKNKEIKWLEAWFKDSMYQSKQGFYAYKRNTTSVLQIPQINRTNSERFELYRKLFKNQLPDLSEEWDSDDDMPAESLKTQVKIDVFDISINKWVKGLVVSNMAGLLSVKLENTLDKTNKWFEIHSDFIAPDGSKATKYTNR